VAKNKTEKGLLPEASKAINNFVRFVVIGLLAISTLFVTSCGSAKPSGTYVFERMILEFSGTTATIMPSDISDARIGGLDVLADAGIDVDGENFQMWANVLIRGAAERKYVFLDDTITTIGANPSDKPKFRMDGNKIMILDEQGNAVETHGEEMTFESRKIALRISYDEDNSVTAYYKKS